MYTWATYTLEDRGFEERIDDTRKAEMEDFFDLENLTATNIARNLKIDFEHRAAEAVMNPANFPSEAAAVNYTEANLDTVDLPRDVELAILRMTERGQMPNTMVISHVLWNFIRRSSLLQNFLYGRLQRDDMNRRMITVKDLQEVFNISTVLVAAATSDTSSKKQASAQTATLSPIWSPGYIWVGKVVGGSFAAGGAGRTLVWDADVPNGLFASETYRDEKRRGDMMRVRSYSKEKIIDETCGQLIVTNFANGPAAQTLAE